MSTIRVRQILSNLNVNQKAALKKLLPAKVSMPSVETQKYPSALLNVLPDDAVGKYAHLGILTEQLLRLPSAEINMDALIEHMFGYLSNFTEDIETKVKASATTQPFLDCLVVTRQALEKVLRSGAEEGSLKYEEEVVYESVAGHPDMWNNTQVFEVKLTGMLKDNWTSFLFQVFAYGALMPSVKDVYLVLPLQKMVWHYSLASWTKRTEFRQFLTSWSTTAQTDRVTAHLNASILCAAHSIGCHIEKVPKAKSKTPLTDTIRGVCHSPAPYQMFLNGGRGGEIKIEDKDIASALALVEQSGARIFVHSEYMINLSNKEVTDENEEENKEEKEDEEENKTPWHERRLNKNLTVTKAFGGKGVVVHVGKYTKILDKYKSIAKQNGEKINEKDKNDKYVKLSIQEGLQNMRDMITHCLEHATQECPLLLETPAGQGTELLTDMKEFLDFVESFGTPKLRACIDTCHVFAAGHDPKTYIETALSRPGLVKLVHYNDSLGTCGSCVDRHAPIFSGEGLIGFPKMSEIAALCTAHTIPMIIE